MFDLLLARLDSLAHRHTGHDEQLDVILKNQHLLMSTTQDALDAQTAAVAKLTADVATLIARSTAPGLTPDQLAQAQKTTDDLTALDASVAQAAVSPA